MLAEVRLSEAINQMAMQFGDADGYVEVNLEILLAWASHAETLERIAFPPLVRDAETGEVPQLSPKADERPGYTAYGRKKGYRG